MSWNKAYLRDSFIVLVLLGAALFVMLTPTTKNAAGTKIQLASLIPNAFGAWTSVEFDMTDYNDKWQSINEVIAREYTNKLTHEQVGLIVEYNSDLRKNFSFHFPEGCYKAAGHEVIFLPSTKISLPGPRLLPVKNLYVRRIENVPNSGDKVLSYWLVIDQKQFSQTFYIKLDQFFAGILSKVKKGFLVRIDSPNDLPYDNKKIGGAEATTNKFVADLYAALDDKKRLMLFGYQK